MPKTNQSPQLSLVALVRNDAGNLRRLLSWHRELYDEALIVDTGSTDGSVAVARKLGARVTEFGWRDDFSAARNHGLQCARGTWILVLDCDEVLAPEDFPLIRTLCQGPPTGWFFEQRNYCAAQDDPRWRVLTHPSALAPDRCTGYVSNPTCRLFPRREDVFYCGVVHEVPEPSLRRAAIPLAPTSVQIHHYGHLITGDLQKKRTLYGKLLRKKLQQNPHDLKVRREMAVQLLSEGHSTLARRLLVRAVRENPYDAEAQPAHLLLGRLLAAEGRWSAAQEQVETAVRNWPELREGWIQAARLHLQRRQPDRAGRYVRQGRILFPEDGTLRSLEARIASELAEMQEPDARFLDGPPAGSVADGRADAG